MPCSLSFLARKRDVATRLAICVLVVIRHVAADMGLRCRLREQHLNHCDVPGHLPVWDSPRQGKTGTLRIWLSADMKTWHWRSDRSELVHEFAFEARRDRDVCHTCAVKCDSSTVCPRYLNRLWAFHDTPKRSGRLIHDVTLEEEVSKEHQHGHHVRDHDNFGEIWCSATAAVVKRHRRLHCYQAELDKLHGRQVGLPRRW
mmetsp:Transcript_98827/g.257617  ORF Transcript_98827/g.257617 Transcript_98827/m.257617 type:complete len:201 (-) Transcript_98827:104-706(-)